MRSARARRRWVEKMVTHPRAGLRAGSVVIVVGEGLQQRRDLVHPGGEGGEPSVMRWPCSSWVSRRAMGFVGADHSGILRRRPQPVLRVDPVAARETSLRAFRDTWASGHGSATVSGLVTAPVRAIPRVSQSRSLLDMRRSAGLARTRCVARQGVGRRRDGERRFRSRRRGVSMW